MSDSLHAYAEAVVADMNDFAEEQVSDAIVAGMQVMHQAIMRCLEGKVAPALLEEIRELPLPELPAYAAE